MITETVGLYQVDPAMPLRHAVEDVFEVRDVTASRDDNSTLRLRGRLRIDAAHAFDIVAARFRDLGYTAAFRRDRDDHIILAVPGRLNPGRSRLWVALLMFGLTILSTVFVGLLFVAGPGADGGYNWLGALAYAVPLLVILLAHELGHYTVARLLGAPVSFPFFIPFPLPPFGTMGAFIQMKAPPRSRRDMLAVAAAGPLAGLVVTLPVLVVGLALSRVGPVLPGTYVQEGNSILYAILKALIFGRFLPSGGIDVALHPVAFAGWAGLLLTALNLIPAGQLDGGHIVYALLNHRARWVTWAAVFALAFAGWWVWHGWLLWAVLALFFSRFRMTPLDDITELDVPGVLLAFMMMIVFVLVFTPIPLT